MDYFGRTEDETSPFVSRMDTRAPVTSRTRSWGRGKMNRFLKTGSGLFVLVVIVYIAWTFHRDVITSISESSHGTKKSALLRGPHRGLPQRPRASDGPSGRMENGIRQIQHRGGNGKVVHRTGQNILQWEEAARRRQGSAVVNVRQDQTSDGSKNRFETQGKDQVQTGLKLPDSDNHPVKDKGSFWKPRLEKLRQGVGKMGLEEIEVPKDSKKDMGDKRKLEAGAKDIKVDITSARTTTTESTKAGKSDKITMDKKQPPLYRPEERVMTTIQPIQRVDTNQQHKSKYNKTDLVKDQKNPYAVENKNATLADYRANKWNLETHKDNRSPNKERDGTSRLQKVSNVDMNDEGSLSRYQKDRKTNSRLKEHNSGFDDLKPESEQQRAIFQNKAAVGDDTRGTYSGGRNEFKKKKNRFGKENAVFQDLKPGMRIAIPGLGKDGLGTKGQRPGLIHQSPQDDQGPKKDGLYGKAQRLMQPGEPGKDPGWGKDNTRPSGQRTSSLYQGLQRSGKLYQGKDEDWNDAKPNLGSRRNGPLSQDMQDRRVIGDKSERNMDTNKEQYPKRQDGKRGQFGDQSVDTQRNMDRDTNKEIYKKRRNKGPQQDSAISEGGGIQRNIDTGLSNDEYPKRQDKPVDKRPGVLASKYQINTLGSADKQKFQILQPIEAGAPADVGLDTQKRRGLLDNAGQKGNPRRHSDRGNDESFHKKIEHKRSIRYQQGEPQSAEAGNNQGAPIRRPLGDAAGTANNPIKYNQQTVNDQQLLQTRREQNQPPVFGGKSRVLDVTDDRSEPLRYDVKMNENAANKQTKDGELTWQSRDQDLKKDQTPVTQATLLVHGTKQWARQREDEVPTYFLHDDPNTYIFSTKSFSQSLRDHPTLSNGHLGTVAGGHWVHMNGLYNGRGVNSHRAALPNTMNAKVTAINGAAVRDTVYELDVSKGMFFIRYAAPGVHVTQRLYTHRSIGALMVLQIEVLVTAPIVAEPVMISLNTTELYNSPDVELTKEVLLNYNMSYASGRTRTPEHSEAKPTSVHIIYDEVPRTLVVPRDQSHVIWTFLYSAHVTKERTLEEYEKGTSLIQAEQIYETHVSAWMRLWEAGRLDIEGNPQLSRMTHSSLYYVMSSLPLNMDETWPFTGLSPSGLPWGSAKEQETDSHQGHVSWDMETWVYPAILALHPRQAKLMLDYRVRHLEQAKVKARKNGHKGAQYPWESSPSGLEVSSQNKSALYEIHGSGGIALAIMQYYWSTGDITIFTDDAYDDVITNVADYWISRLTQNQTSGLYEIKDVMGPDEFYNRVDNSVYTNVVAQMTLRAAASVTMLLKRVDDSLMYTKYANLMYIPYDEVLDYHPEYTGYRAGSPVQQADAVLLGYPLQYDLTKSQRRNDLAIYEKVTDSDAPPMTWSMHAIAWLELGEKEKAWDNMLKNMKHSQNEVWSESFPSKGAVHHLPSMGAFLQAMLHGYGGIRITKNKMDIQFELPNNVTSYRMVGINYLGHEMTIHVTSSDLVVYVTDRRADAVDLVITSSDKLTFDLKNQSGVRILSRKASILKKKV